MTGVPEFEPLDGLMLDDLEPEEYLLLLDWCLVWHHPFEQPDLAWYVQHSMMFRQDLLLWRIVERANLELRNRWYRRLWRWCWRSA